MSETEQRPAVAVARGGIKHALQGAAEGGMGTLALLIRVIPLVLGDARLRGIFGGGLAAGLGVLGLHVAGDTLLAVIGVGMTLAVAGPHQPVTGEVAHD